MKVPFMNLKKQHRILSNEIKKVLGSVLRGANFIMGSDLLEFEKKFAEYIGCKYAVGVGSGTGALHLALLACGVKKGDEVLVPANTYIADALAVEYCGATLKLIDIDENYYVMTPFSLYNNISKKTKVAIPVHLYGQGCNVAGMNKVKKSSPVNITLIEDCAQSIGCKPNNEQTGSSNIGCFSFYPAKNLGCCGDGGMITTNSQKIYDKLIALRNYGSQKKYYNNIIGYNCRLDTIQATILAVKLKYLDEWNEMRRVIACTYAEFLGDCEEVILPEIWFDHVWHLFVIRVNKKIREIFMDYLKRKGIGVQLHYPIPIHKQECFKDRKLGKFPITEKLSKEIVSLPMFPEITKTQIKYVCTEIKDFFAMKNKRR